jgi:hypothetical protein
MVEEHLRLMVSSYERGDGSLGWLEVMEEGKGGKVREVMEGVLLEIHVEVQVAGLGCSSGCRCDREDVAVVQPVLRRGRQSGCGPSVQGFSHPAILRWLDSGRGSWG